MEAATCAGLRILALETWMRLPMGRCYLRLPAEWREHREGGNKKLPVNTVKELARKGISSRKKESLCQCSEQSLKSGCCREGEECMRPRDEFSNYFS